MFVREDREANSRPPVVPVKVKVSNGSLTSSQNNHGRTASQSQEVNNNKGVSTSDEDDVKHNENSSQCNELSAPVPQETETQGGDAKSKQHVSEEEEGDDEEEEDDSLIAELIN
jgi:hypothetical protein